MTLQTTVFEVEVKAIENRAKVDKELDAMVLDAVTEKKMSTLKIDIVQSEKIEHTAKFFVTDGKKAKKINDSMEADKLARFARLVNGITDIELKESMKEHAGFNMRYAERLLPMAYTVYVNSADAAKEDEQGITLAHAYRSVLYMVKNTVRALGCSYSDAVEKLEWRQDNPRKKDTIVYMNDSTLKITIDLNSADNDSNPENGAMAEAITCDMVNRLIVDCSSRKKNELRGKILNRDLGKTTLYKLYKIAEITGNGLHTLAIADFEDMLYKYYK